MSRLRLYNTLTRSKEDFVPIDEKNVRMYVCGPTVYDFAHIGNARPAIVFDVLFRLLRHLYGADHVKYVRNITDVDDKINARAAGDFPDLPLNDAIRRVTETTANQYQADTLALGCLPPTEQPRATDNINEMIEVIAALIQKGHAYQAAGEVLFSVPSMPDYGRLSRRVLDEQQAGARIAVEAHKRDPADFVLWKLSSENEPGWSSPWGRGRPGWHIECSAMSRRYLGETFDIHGGGLDLIFPHHENEIAQSRCAFGHDVMAKVWMHNGFLQVEGEKMSKSLGNFVTIRDLLCGLPADKPTWHGKDIYRGWSGFVLRLAMFGTHYRQPINWTLDRLLDAEKTLEAWIDLARVVDVRPNESVPEEIVAALTDDLNMPAVISLLHQLRDDCRSKKTGANAQDLAMSYLAPRRKLRAALDFLGLFDYEMAQMLLRNENAAIDEPSSANLGFDRKLVSELISARLAARANKNWAESDRIRDELAAMGIALKDNKDGTTTWEVKR
jgi:cysteinyl-tRNA synthetase